MRHQATSPALQVGRSREGGVRGQHGPLSEWPFTASSRVRVDPENGGVFLTKSPFCDLRGEDGPTLPLGVHGGKMAPPTEALFSCCKTHTLFEMLIFLAEVKTLSIKVLTFWVQCGTTAVYRKRLKLSRRLLSTSKSRNCLRQSVPSI